MGEPKLEDCIAICDSREQRPLELMMPTIRGTLKTGDYSIQGLEESVSIERKSLEDFVACCGAQRERFMAEMERILAFKTRAVVIEASWGDLEAGNWRGRVKVASVIGTALSLIERQIPVLCTDNRPRAGRFVSRILYFAKRNDWRLKNKPAAQ